MPRKRELDLRPIYYCYGLFDWLGVPRYIGKGKDGSKRENSHHKQFDLVNWRKNEFIEQTWIILDEIPKVIIRKNLTEKEAFETEIALIAAIGRIDKGTGTLVNMTDGGEGQSNPSEQTRELMSKRAKERAIREGPDYRSEMSRKGAAATSLVLTTERRREIGKNTVRDLDKCREDGRRGAAALTPEQRMINGRKTANAQSYEFRSNYTRESAAKISPEVLKARGRAGAAGLIQKYGKSGNYEKLKEWWTPEKHRESGIKANKTRLLNIEKRRLENLDKENTD